MLQKYGNDKKFGREIQCGHEENGVMKALFNVKKIYIIKSELSDNKEKNKVTWKSNFKNDKTLPKTLKIKKNLKKDEKYC